MDKEIGFLYLFARTEQFVLIIVVVTEYAPKMVIRNPPIYINLKIFMKLLPRMFLLLQSNSHFTIL